MSYLGDAISCLRMEEARMIRVDGESVRATGTNPLIFKETTFLLRLLFETLKEDYGEEAANEIFGVLMYLAKMPEDEMLERPAEEVYKEIMSKINLGRSREGADE